MTLSGACLLPGPAAESRGAKEILKNYKVIKCVILSFSKEIIMNALIFLGNVGKTKIEGKM